MQNLHMTFCLITRGRGQYEKEDGKEKEEGKGRELTGEKNSKHIYVVGE